jgi:hypothetical protein
MKHLQGSKMTRKREKIQEHFTNGFEIGFGVGFIMTFVVLWISLLFGAQLTSGVTYETMIAIFIYPLLFLLTVGTVFLTAGAVKHLHFEKKIREEEKRQKQSENPKEK